MRKLKFFLASSSELEEDRRAFEIFIGRENKTLADKDLFIELIIWEDFIDAMSQTRLQDEYNKLIQECDIFILLFFTKVGKYTDEEFETAFGQFQATNKPLIYTYFKNAEVRIGDIVRADMQSLWKFQDKLHALGHFHTVYENMDGLKYHFKQQLSKYLDGIEPEQNDALESVHSVIDTLSEIGSGNEKLLLELLDETEPRTRDYLMAKSGFSSNKVNRIIRRLLNKNQLTRIEENGMEGWVKR